MSNVLQENLQKYHGRISVAKRHALYNKVLSTGELYNPHVHASFAPWQFLKMWNGTTSTMRTPNPEKVITAALRMLKILKDYNTDEDSYKAIENIVYENEVEESLRRILSFSRYCLDENFDKEFECYPSVESVLRTFGVTLRTVECFGPRRVGTLAYCYLVFPYTYRAYIACTSRDMGTIDKPSNRISNSMSTYFIVHQGSAYRVRQNIEKYVDIPEFGDIYYDFLMCTEHLCRAYLDFGRYLTIKYFYTFRDKYNISDDLADELKEALDYAKQTACVYHQTDDVMLTRLKDSVMLAETAETKYFS